MRTAHFALLFLSLVVTACGQKSGFRADNLPTESAGISDIDPTESAKVPDLKEGSDTENSAEKESDSDNSNAQEKPEMPDLEFPDTPEIPKPNNASATSEKKSIVDIGIWVIQNEAKEVGAACNFYVQRVLQLMGFGKSSWKANDFDLFVNKNFSNYKVESFVPSSQGEEKNRLRKYLWSFPERTGLILQWKRKVGPGHVAIVHRHGDQLVIYHASLNRFVAKAQTIDLKVLLYQGGNAYRLNVYSGLGL